MKNLRLARMISYCQCKTTSDFLVPVESHTNPSKEVRKCPDADDDSSKGFVANALPMDGSVKRVDCDREDEEPAAHIARVQ